MDIVVLIPSLNPDQKLVKYVEELCEYGFSEILIINDGSSGLYEPLFEQCRQHPQCTILTHEVNRGKGRAIKTGIEYYLEHFAGRYAGMVTGDADGQHALADTARVAQMVIEDKQNLILGSRSFDGDDVPARSRFGNKTTSFVFKLCYGQKVVDTQTGLRGIPNAIMPWLLEIAGERFEYEMNMLVECSLRKVKIIELPIETIYIDENDSSHFKVVRDSVKVYWQLLGRYIKYLTSGLVSFGVDIGLYAVLVSTGLLDFLGDKSAVSVAYVAARVVSCFCNYLINKKVVFYKKGNYASTMVKYLVTVVIVLLLSMGAMSAVLHIFSVKAEDTVIAKMVIDFVLMFSVSYNLQQKWVFKKR